jgi:hypothetical protein
MRPTPLLRYLSSRRAVAALTVLVSVLMSSACTTSNTPVVNWSLGPITLSLSANGEIEISGQKQFVTQIGTFSFGEKYSGEAGASALILVIRHKRGTEVVDDVYKVPTSADVQIDVDGKTQLGIKGRTITLDATLAKIDNIVLTGVTWIMPDLRGVGFQEAQDRLGELTQDAVSYTSAYDASGQGRAQRWDLNWKVCTQSIPPGTPITADSIIGFGVVLTDEYCPDGSAPSAAVWTMPSEINKGLDQANSDLQELTSGAIAGADTHDATGAGQSQYYDANWVVCYQTPAPGSTITSATSIEFGVVARGSPCPATPY